jgi:hypothetical protein
MVTSRKIGIVVAEPISLALPALLPGAIRPSGVAMILPMVGHGRITNSGIPSRHGKGSQNDHDRWSQSDKIAERRCRMKKLTYVKPKVVGSANVHPC